jgi:hypothetical protein
MFENFGPFKRETSVQDIIALARAFCPRAKYKHRPGLLVVKTADGQVELKRIASCDDLTFYTLISLK